MFTSQAFQAGYNEFISHAGRCKDNPFFPDDVSYVCWEEGWCKAKEEYEAERSERGRLKARLEGFYHILDINLDKVPPTMLKLHQLIELRDSLRWAVEYLEEAKP